MFNLERRMMMRVMCTRISPVSRRAIAIFKSFQRDLFEEHFK